MYVSPRFESEDHLGNWEELLGFLLHYFGVDSFVLTWILFTMASVALLGNISDDAQTGQLDSDERLVQGLTTLQPFQFPLLSLKWIAKLKCFGLHNSIVVNGTVEKSMIDARKFNCITYNSLRFSLNMPMLHTILLLWTRGIFCSHWLVSLYSVQDTDSSCSRQCPNSADNPPKRLFLLLFHGCLNSHWPVVVDWLFRCHLPLDLDWTYLAECLAPADGEGSILSGSSALH